MNEDDGLGGNMEDGSLGQKCEGFFNTSNLTLEEISKQFLDFKCIQDCIIYYRERKK